MSRLRERFFDASGLSIEEAEAFGLTYFADFAIL